MNLNKLSTVDRIQDHTPVSVLRDRLNYDAETGVITWRIVKPKSSSAIGKEAGGTNVAGYRRIKIDRVTSLAHRIAWALHFGVYPDGVLDHANGVKTDNRISNLRLSTMAQNQMNRRTPRNNTSGHRGVTWNSGLNKWSARCAANGKRVHLGYFDDAEIAHQVYQRAAKSLHGEFLFKE